MKNWIILIAALAVLPASGRAQSVPSIPFDSVPNPVTLPKDMFFGEVSGVAVNSKGHVFIFSRGGTTGPAYGAAASQLFEFDADGKFLREIGKNLYAWSYAHTVRIDKDDHIWAVDKGSDMIVKFDPEGRVEMVFGRKQEASDANGPIEKVHPPRPPINGLFRQPTDVTWDTKGNIFISDGYVNSRVAKFDKDGNPVKSWGEPGDKPGQFNTPHSIAADAKGNIFVADRENNRIQVFDPDGKFLRLMTIDVPYDKSARPMLYEAPTDGKGALAAGAPWALCITPGPNQMLYAADGYPGRVYKMTLDGKILGVLGSTGKQLKQFGWIHEIACPNENTLYVAELLNWRVQKLLLHPAK